MIEVEVKLYATLRKYHPGAGLGQPVLLEVAEGTTLTGLLDQLGIPVAEAKIVFVNNMQQDLSYSLQPGDRVGVFPPIAGG